MRGIRIRGSASKGRARRSGGVGWVKTIDVHGEEQLRCTYCGAVVAPAKWWFHGTSEDPHRPPET